MGAFVRGAVVVLPLPFSDLSGAKRRPALVVADLTGDDIILCQITSQMQTHHGAVSLVDSDFESGSFRRDSSVRPDRLFTADGRIVL